MRPTVPELLEKASGGDEFALSALVPVLYDELHRIAARQLSHDATLIHCRRQL